MEVTDAKHYGNGNVGVHNILRQEELKPRFGVYVCGIVLENHQEDNNDCRKSSRKFQGMRTFVIT
uniref:Uncharacterized protein n=1 Tax=Salix viminalis TaxID=40686 RepID=A0A6N2MVA2_SALVM